uniref:Tafazzin family protein n=1 Tax=Strongyloides venezuelensis TaxID=75913 RepID=A0A0K0G0A3_STRVS
MNFKDIKKPLVSQFQYPWPFPRQDSLYFKLKSRLVMTTVFMLSKLVFSKLMEINGGVNKVNLYGKEKFLKCLRDINRPLITMSNHRSNIDDPLMWASLLTCREFFANIPRFRFALAASDVCFTNPIFTKFFSLGRCVPCVRGEGVFQKGVDFCIEKLNENGWVHIFPEGKVETKPIRHKWGIGRLVDQCRVPPTVIPIWIKGMDKVYPSKKRYVIYGGNTVEIIVGDPIDMSLYIKTLPPSLEEIGRRKLITDFLQDKLLYTGNASLGIEPDF